MTTPPTIESMLLIAAVLLLMSVIGSRASGALGVPALILFLGIGMLAGSEGPGGIYFNDPYLAQSLGVIALIFILFSGGLSTDWKTVRPVFFKALSLSTLGVLFTALILGAFAHHILGFSVLESLLLGAIVSSTDAAAVFAVLRSRNVSLKGEMKPLLEFESGSNDPMAVFLTTMILQLLQAPGSSPLRMVPFFFQQMILGAAIGYGMAKVTIWVTNRLRLEYEGLYPVLVLAFVVLTYGMASALNGNGFLAVYLVGLVMGNASFAHKRSAVRFHDGLAWLMQIVMFLVLGLLVYPSHLLPVAGQGSLIAVCLMLVARPVGVQLSLLFSKMSLRERALVSWVGLRGAVPIILATFPLLAGFEKAEIIFNIVFFVVLASVLLQGTTIPFVAKLLKLDAPLEKNAPRYLEFERPAGGSVDLLELVVPYESPIVGKPIMALGIPKECLITLIVRGEDYIVPQGTTTLLGGDVIACLTDETNLKKLQSILEGKDK